MPSKPKDIGTFIDPGYAKQREQNYDRNVRDNSTARKLRNTRRWQKVRALKLSKTPLCEDPFNVHNLSGKTLATTVHHINPLHSHPHLAYVMNNLASLCETCHNTLEGRTMHGEETRHLWPNAPR